MQMTAPWGITVRDNAALTVLAVTSGRALVDGVLLTEGDVALIRGPEQYEVTDTVASTPTINIGPGQQCTTADGHDLREDFRHGVRRWGNTEDGETAILVGTYARPDEAGGLAARALPRLAVVPRDQADHTLVDLLVREISQDNNPAAQVVIDRLLDVLVITTIRRWIESPGRSTAPTWLTTTDPVVIDALELLHAAPEAPWTVESLARRVNTSRASLAARFRRSVGEPPMSYLTRWRFTLAGDLLQIPGTTVAHVAHSVGYNNAYSFSTAFKRHLGITPSEFRHHRPVLSGGVSEPNV